MAEEEEEVPEDIEESALKQEEAEEVPEEEPTEALWVCKEHGVIEEPLTEEGRNFCPECHKILAKKTREELEEEPPEGEELAPPEVEARERITELLKERLPTVYGISDKRAKAIIGTVEQDPSLLDNLNSLYFHIRQMGGGNINDYHLQRILRGIYNEVGVPVSQQQPGVMPQAQMQQQSPAPMVSGGVQRPLQPMSAQPQQRRPAQPRQRQPAQTKPKKTYKIVVDGQEIETDEKGLRAWKEYKDERKERERRRESEEETVEIPIGEDETAEVPASQAPLYTQLMQQQMQIEQLRQEQESGEEETVKIPTEEGSEEIPVSQAPFYTLTKTERAKREAAEKRTEQLQGRIEDLESKLRDEMAARSKAESPSYSLISGAKDDFEEKADRLFAMMEQGRMPRLATSAPKSSGEGGPKYSPEERREKEEKLQERIEGAGKRAEHEEKVIKAAKELAEES